MIPDGAGPGRDAGAGPDGSGHPEGSAEPDGSFGAGAGIEIELDTEGSTAPYPGLPVGEDLRRLVETAAAAAGVSDGHVAITLVSPDDIHALNLEHRGKDRPTDVLSFPVDGAEPVAGPRELGDVLICPEHTVSLRETVVHGILHLVGYDHETDHGEMLALQGEILAWYPAPGVPA